MIQTLIAVTWHLSVRCYDDDDVSMRGSNEIDWLTIQSASQTSPKNDCIQYMDFQCSNHSSLKPEKKSNKEKKI